MTRDVGPTSALAITAPIRDQRRRPGIGHAALGDMGEPKTIGKARFKTVDEAKAVARTEALESVGEGVETGSRGFGSMRTPIRTQLPEDYGTRPGDVGFERMPLPERDESRARLESERFKRAFGVPLPMWAGKSDDPLKMPVWDDDQSDFVTADEYLRSTAPQDESHVIEDTAEAVGKAVKKQFSRKYGTSALRNYVIEKTVKPVLGRTAAKVVGGIASTASDLTETLDAPTLDIVRNRRMEEAQQQANELAKGFKRQAVLDAVQGGKYEPLFLGPLKEGARKYTDSLIDWAPRPGRDGGMFDRRNLDQSAGQPGYEPNFMAKYGSVGYYNPGPSAARDIS